MITTLICLGAIATDGDTIACLTGERIRLAGIEANELRGGCHLPVCPAMPARQAKDALQGLIGYHELRCDITGRSYRRLVGWCVTRDGAALSCEAIRMRVAVRWAKFDPEQRLKGCER